MNLGVFGHLSAHLLVRRGLKINKNFCRGSRGTVFLKRVPRVAEGLISGSGGGSSN